MAKKTEEQKMMEMNVTAHNMMQNLTEEDDAFYNKHGYRESKKHTSESVTQIAEDLISVARRIYDYRIAVALGEKPKEALNRGFVEYQQYIIDLVEPMIKDYQQKKTIDAKSANEVVKLLKGGKVTPKEAIELLTVVGKSLEVEERETRKKLQDLLMAGKGVNDGD